jgi:hypothetical protein
MATTRLIVLASLRFGLRSLEAKWAELEKRSAVGRYVPQQCLIKSGTACGVTK